MLQPRETDLPALFMVLVVLPLVAYVLLGKWSEAAKKNERISELAQLAAQEEFRAEAMTAAAVIPLVPVSKPTNGFHTCARCFSPAMTRCSRCKSVRYCSGKCQIIHWRQVHKQECRELEYDSSCASPSSDSNEESVGKQFLFDVCRMPDARLPEEGNGIVVNNGFMKMIGLRRSSKHEKVERSEVDGHKKIKMLFPYEEFVKFFRCEAFDLLPRGLVNCGNSCYANAVLQCLTSTKPLTIYLLRRSHSRACCAKTWCLICELEHHVLMLRDHREPLSLSRILLHMQSVSNQIGNGSQEDAHEFLRLLVTSMQSICLEGLGGEGVVDPKLQETTFIQHTFGGQLRSKVKCLRCHHESVRYENIMDLTLEIYGWVNSLEGALTQFTRPEDLDGENMYRCGRCAAYVQAQKQLAIHEAPNILTIVLKRFQEGNYGKINKCITFPDLLDMIPFMTGTDDVPPLYMLYGVVVHLDTMNAAFSGHYISYVKDLLGNWFRIDDTQVQPVSSSQVMSEGAYILFYMRSCPRPPRTYSGKPKARKSMTDHTHKPKDFRVGSSQNRPPPSVDVSDVTSDWSNITSSDDASFTTESTRDSFSTIDYTDNDSISSIFNAFYAPPDYAAPCSKPRTVSRQYQAGEPPYRLQKVCLSDSGSHCGLYMDGNGVGRTSGRCTF